MVADGDDFIDPFAATPAPKGERQVRTDGDDNDVVGQVCGFSIEARGLNGSGRRINRRNRAVDTDLTGRAVKRVIR